MEQEKKKEPSFRNKHRRLVSVSSKPDIFYDRSNSVPLLNSIKETSIESRNLKGPLKQNCFLKAVKHKVRNNKEKQPNDPYQMVRKAINPPPCSKMEGPLKSLHDDEDEEPINPVLAKKKRNDEEIQ